MPKKYLLIIFITLSQSFVAKAVVFKNYDALENKEYSYLINKIHSSKDKNSTRKYAQAWLTKSKSEKNWNQIIGAYETIMFQNDKKGLLKYADSILSVAKQSKDNNLIGSAYLTKGIIYYDKKEHRKALDNYLLADEYLSQTKNEYTIHKVKYSIASIKYYLGFYHEAIALFKECLNYFEEENDRAYLNSLHSIGLCYTKIIKYDSCSYYNKMGIELGRKYNITEMEPYFNHSEGVNQYFKKNYTTAITKLEEIVPTIQAKKDFANETVAYFYIGKSYWKLKQTNKAIPFFLKVDKAFVEYNYTRPDLRENYELLIDFYKKQNNIALQLTYIDKLLKVDSTLNLNYKYLSKKIFKEYDTKKLLKAKEEIEYSLRIQSQISYLVIISLLGAIVYLSYRHFKNKKQFKQKFKELMNEKKQKEIIITENNNDGELDINPELVQTISQNLEKFEKNKKYLEKDMNLNKLATLLKTNTKYASKIIVKYRGKKTIEYVNDLKIDHIVELLKKENKYRYYTNKALGEEAGFGSTQNFTRAFNTRTGISPTYFIQELKKSFPQ